MQLFVRQTPKPKTPERIALDQNYDTARHKIREIMPLYNKVQGVHKRGGTVSFCNARQVQADYYKAESDLQALTLKHDRALQEDGYDATTNDFSRLAWQFHILRRQYSNSVDPADRQEFKTALGLALPAQLPDVPANAQARIGEDMIETVLEYHNTPPSDPAEHIRHNWRTQVENQVATDLKDALNLTPEARETFRKRAGMDHAWNSSTIPIVDLLALSDEINKADKAQAIAQNFDRNDPASLARFRRTTLQSLDKCRLRPSECKANLVPDTGWYTDGHIAAKMPANPPAWALKAGNKSSIDVAKFLKEQWPSSAEQVVLLGWTDFELSGEGNGYQITPRMAYCEKADKTVIGLNANLLRALHVLTGFDNLHQGEKPIVFAFKGDKLMGAIMPISPLSEYQQLGPAL